MATSPSNAPHTAEGHTYRRPRRTRTWRLSQRHSTKRPDWSPSPTFRMYWARSTPSRRLSTWPTARGTGTHRRSAGCPAPPGRRAGSRCRLLCILGPQNVRAYRHWCLFGKEKWLNAIPPYQGGGEMIGHVTFEKTTFNELPFKFEAGDPRLHRDDGLCQRPRLHRPHRHRKHCRPRTRSCCNTPPAGSWKRLTAYASTAQPPRSVASSRFLCATFTPYDMGMLLDKLGFALRSGHHCAPTAHGTVRHRRNAARLVCPVQHARRVRGFCPGRKTSGLHVLTDPAPTTYTTG